MNKQQLYLNLIASWGDLPIDEEAVKEMLDEFVEKEKVLAILDQAEDENWFDMPDTTENWKTWKRIRNTINDH
jgi:hypothetical protein